MKITITYENTELVAIREAAKRNNVDSRIMDIIHDMEKGLVETSASGNGGGINIESKENCVQVDLEPEMVSGAISIFGMGVKKFMPIMKVFAASFDTAKETFKEAKRLFKTWGAVQDHKYAQKRIYDCRKLIIDGADCTVEVKRNQFDKLEIVRMEAPAKYNLQFLEGQIDRNIDHWKFNLTKTEADELFDCLGGYVKEKEEGGRNIPSMK